MRVNVVEQQRNWFITCFKGCEIKELPKDFCQYDETDLAAVDEHDARVLVGFF